MKHRVVKQIGLLIAAMVLLAGCDPYASIWKWSLGPQCVKPTDNFKRASVAEIDATAGHWVNTQITLADGDALEIELIKGNEVIPVTFCGRHEYTTTTTGARNPITVAINAKNENWTPTPPDIPMIKENDALYITTGIPNATGGIDGNKWSWWEAPGDCSAPGGGGQPCGGGGTGTGSLPWYNSKDIYSDDNNACIYPDNDGVRDSTGKKCWFVYGQNVEYRLNANTSTAPAGGGTQRPLLPYQVSQGAVTDITQLSEPERQSVIINPVPSDGYLQFRMVDQPGLYGDNPGGLTVEVKHYGCPKKNGEGLVAYVGNDTPDDTTSPTWSDFLVATDAAGEQFSFKTDSPPLGRLWLKMNDPDGDYTPASNEGSYRLNLKVKGNRCTPTAANPSCDPDAPNNIISTVVEFIVGKIEQVLLRAQQDLFEGLAGVNGSRVGTMVNFIRASLVLYIALYGAAFAFGLVQSPQLDFLIRMVKVAVVVQLVSPNAWNFFNTYFFSIFTDGTRYIIYILNKMFDTQTIYGTGDVWVQNIKASWNAGGQKISFAFLDRTLGQFLEQSFWIRVISLLFAGPMGWLYIIAIIVGMVAFIKGVLTAILAYVVSLIAMAMLIGIAPLFLVFMLFTQTRDLFQAWIQQLANYALRPIVMFAVLAVFNFLMWGILIRMVSYGACWKCIWNVKVDVDFIPNLCVLYFYQPFAYDNFGDAPNTLMPISFVAVLSYLVIAALTAKFIPFSEGIVSSITKSTASASLLAPAGALAQDLKGTVGMDKASIKRRASAAAGAKASAQKEKSVRRSVLAQREEERKGKDRAAGGKGMAEFEKKQVEAREKELEQLKKDMGAKGDGPGSPGAGGPGVGSVKERAKLLEQLFQGSRPPNEDEQAGGEGMAKFEKDQLEQRRTELERIQEMHKVSDKKDKDNNE